MKKSMCLSDTQDSLNSFKAKLTPTQKMNIKVKHYHSGKWEKASPSKQKSGSQSDSEEEE